jgi:hypothetical protein
MLIFNAVVPYLGWVDATPLVWSMLDTCPGLVFNDALLWSNTSRWRWE